MKSVVLALEGEIMKDAELIALSELVATERLCMEMDNKLREIQGYAPAYDGSVQWNTRDKLQEELKRRNVI